MKPDIHPDYRPVVFIDTSSGEKTLTRSTIQTQETIVWEDGETYPLAKVEISSASHPFFTGQMTIVDTAGRVERFERRYGKRKRTTGGAGQATAEAETETKVEPVSDVGATTEAKAGIEAEATTEAEPAAEAATETDAAVETEASAETEVSAESAAEDAAETPATAEDSDSQSEPEGS